MSVGLRGSFACPGCALTVVLPLRAAQLIDVTLDGEACPGGNYSVAPGFGQSVVTVSTTAPTEGASVTVSLRYGEAAGYARATKVEGVTGGRVELHIGAGTTVERIEDPQRALASHTVAGGIVSGVLSSEAVGHSLVSVVVRLGTGSGKDAAELTQRRLFKLNVTDPVGEREHAAKVEVSHEEVKASAFTLLNITSLLNGNLSEIFHPHGGYKQPRPETCSSRIATDGYSPWSFKGASASQGDLPPYPNFDNVSSSGLVTTGVGARFQLQHTDDSNVAFVSQWENYPKTVTVPLAGHNTTAGHVVWLLISGSTNNMQTRLANAVIRFSYTDGSEEELFLTPPLNYWSLTPIAGIDYDYGRDNFCLPPVPPPTVQLGHANRAMVYSWRAKGEMASVTVEALSLEVVLGLLAVSVGRAA